MTDEQDKITTALAKAQLEIGAVIYNKINPHFRSKYADLAAIRDAIKDPLAKNGLVVVQTTKMIDAALYLSTKLQHVSGQFIESIYPIKIGTPQQMGSELTYARRYGISAMLNLAAEDDDDANAAEEAPAVPKMAAKEAKKLADDLIAEVNKCQSTGDIDHLSKDAKVKEILASLPAGEKARVGMAGQAARDKLTKTPMADELPAHAR